MAGAASEAPRPRHQDAEISNVGGRRQNAGDLPLVDDGDAVANRAQFLQLAGDHHDRGAVLPVVFAQRIKH